MSNYFEYEKPKFKKGDTFSYGDKKKYKVLGTTEVIADYITGRKGICYVIKDSAYKKPYAVPCWQLERSNEVFNRKK